MEHWIIDDVPRTYTTTTSANWTYITSATTQTTPYIRWARGTVYGNDAEQEYNPGEEDISIEDLLGIGEVV